MILCWNYKFWSICLKISLLRKDSCFAKKTRKTWCASHAKYAQKCEKKIIYFKKNYLLRQVVILKSLDIYTFADWQFIPKFDILMFFLFLKYYVIATLVFYRYPMWALFYPMINFDQLIQFFLQGTVWPPLGIENELNL